MSKGGISAADWYERRRLAERGRAAVLARHTFDARATVLVETAEAVSRARTAAASDPPASSPA